MNFYIVDDEKAVRLMLSQIIEDEDLGEVVGEAENGSLVDQQMLILKNVDILFIDLLMPIQDGIKTIRQIKPSFKGKIIMVSQVESKELIAEAYSLGVEYFIIKPINRIEVLAVVQKVIERIQLEKSIKNIQESLNTVLKLDIYQSPQEKYRNEKHISTSSHFRNSIHFLLSELGIATESGSKDLMDMLDYLYKYEQDKTFEQGFPSLREIFMNLAQKKLGESIEEAELKRSIEASKQRIRRAIYQSLNHLASLGLTDFLNPKFENYASRFFDFTIVRRKMTELNNEPTSPTRIDMKRFIQVLYFEAKQIHFELQ
ncbi:Protein-glutamate methylesterase/protein-glutamine glutaminase [Bacillus rhizoplanae]|uniref:Protein-glutamate methylesterase/protein-glutamine glutaminase n=1 Tax=Bacillus rhizoplanae TaxID=2880966 RepID=A0ABN8A1B4_9BACI|nr:response regulator [Bacillus rhizoplanae]CAG9614902.1 Protein-glutamate methylesterase/protein-glutamine glutaminase [Bacillus rhizoplanae]